VGWNNNRVSCPLDTRLLASSKPRQRILIGGFHGDQGFGLVEHATQLLDKMIHIFTGLIIQVFKTYIAAADLVQEA
jgi:hypothetical protein